MDMVDAVDDEEAEDEHEQDRGGHDDAADGSEDSLAAEVDSDGNSL